MEDKLGDNSSLSRGVSEMKHLESQQKYELLLELCPDGILIVQNRKIKESNHLMAKMCGYAAEEILDTEFASFFHPGDMARIEKICAKSIQDPNSIEIHEATLMCKNGIKLFAELSAGNFVYNQQPAILFIVRDISDRVQSQKEREKARKPYTLKELGDTLDPVLNPVS